MVSLYAQVMESRWRVKYHWWSGFVALCLCFIFAYVSRVLSVLFNGVGWLDCPVFFVFGAVGACWIGWSWMLSCAPSCEACPFSSSVNLLVSKHPRSTASFGRLTALAQCFC
jgi:hypothetical protein